MRAIGLTEFFPAAGSIQSAKKEKAQKIKVSTDLPEGRPSFAQDSFSQGFRECD